MPTLWHGKRKGKHLPKNIYKIPGKYKCNTGVGIVSESPKTLTDISYTFLT